MLRSFLCVYSHKKNFKNRLFFCLYATQMSSLPLQTAALTPVPTRQPLAPCAALPPRLSALFIPPAWVHECSVVPELAHKPPHIPQPQPCGLQPSKARERHFCGDLSEMRMSVTGRLSCCGNSLYPKCRDCCINKECQPPSALITSFTCYTPFHCPIPFA